MLMLFSLTFYYWGERDHIFIMLVCIFINYSCAIFIDKSSQQNQRRFYLVTSIAASLSLLIYFKYFNFFLEPLNRLAGFELTSIKKIVLPLGISFYTFHALSYVIDVYWKKVEAEKNIVIFICYVAFFPQLVAGPIVRYKDIGHSFYHRYITRAGLRNGIIRFSFGLAKKVLIANEVAKLADGVFSLPLSDLSFLTAWLGALAYTLQIYFDFSGYSDMAIGLGLMFGFRYKENFNFPYNALSMQAFWRKWHISLSSWFRDYVYIPLGGSYLNKWQTGINLLTIFILCGIWHGANYTFVIWGLYHGFFLVLERTSWGRWMSLMPSVIRHSYVLLVVMIGWVFFREEHMSDALNFIAIMFTFNKASIDMGLLDTLFNPMTVMMLLVGIFVSFGPSRRIAQKLGEMRHGILIKYYQYVNIIGSQVLFFISIFLLSTNAYNPFLYFRF